MRSFVVRRSSIRLTLPFSSQRITTRYRLVASLAFVLIVFSLAYPVGATIPAPAPVPRTSGNNVPSPFAGNVPAGDTTSPIPPVGGGSALLPVGRGGPTQASVPSPMPPARATPIPTGTSPWWRPTIGLQWQLDYTLPPPLMSGIDVYIVDFSVSAAAVTQIHATGAKAVCYVDLGTWEDWRPDAASYPSAILGNTNGGWPHERYVDIRAASLRLILRARYQSCRDRGFDGVYSDNADGYEQTTGFPLTAADQLGINKWVASTLHGMGLASIIGNDFAQIPQLASVEDAGLAEQCSVYGSCGQFAPYIAAGKPVFAVEYSPTTTQVCPILNAAHYDGALFPIGGNGVGRLACRVRQ